MTVLSSRNSAVTPGSLKRWRFCAPRQAVQRRRLTPPQRPSRRSRQHMAPMRAWKLDDEAIESLAAVFVEASEEEAPEQRREKIEAVQKRLKARRTELAGQLDGVRKQQKAAAKTG